MSRKHIYMGTTQIAAEKTAAKIMQVLVSSGARQIATEYDGGGKIIGLRFVMSPIPGVQVAFSLPVRTDVLLPKLGNDPARAERVAWRQLLRWVQAQFAMIEIGMVRAEEVYAPYMLQADGRTLFELMSASRFKALPAPEDSAKGETNQ